MKKNFKDEEKLKWACRRGMLELDVLLGNFLNNNYLDLQPKQQQLFKELLTSSDPELFAWLMGHETPQDLRFIPLIEMIRRYGKSKI